MFAAYMYIQRAWMPQIPVIVPASSNPGGTTSGLEGVAPAGFSSDDRKNMFFTFLIIGLDGGVSTDTIIVGSYDSSNTEGHIISIPRDSLVNVRRNVRKINAAFAAGSLNGGGREGGIAQLRREIKTIIGFMPDFYVCIDLEAFERIVDAVGGIYIDIPRDMKYTDPTPGQELFINIPAGFRHLNGETALHFARFRLSDTPGGSITDYTRIENQQTVIEAVLDRLLRPSSLLKIPDFIQIFNETVHSDLSTENMLWFANQLNRIRGTEALIMHTLPTTGTSGQPMYYELLDASKIVELVNSTINPFTKDIRFEDLDIVNR